VIRAVSVGATDPLYVDEGPRSSSTGLTPIWPAVVGMTANSARRTGVALGFCVTETACPSEERAKRAQGRYSLIL
jgi:hypothetical protein